MKRYSIAALALFVVLVGVFAYDVSVPNEVPDYKHLEVRLILAEGEAVEQARFYFKQEGKEELLYAPFELKEGVWSAIVSYEYLKGEELSYYLQVQTPQGKFFRNPTSGWRKARLLHDVSPPGLSLMSPEGFKLAIGKEQLVVFKVEDESDITDFEIFQNGNPLLQAAYYQGLLAFAIKPQAVKKNKIEITIGIVDRYNNKFRETYSFDLVREKGPAFSANADYVADLDVKYEIGLGKNTTTASMAPFFADFSHDLITDYELGGEASLKAGPLKLGAGLTLADELSIFEAIADPTGRVLNPLIADYQNIMNLWNPWSFDNEFVYTGEEPRLYYNNNEMYIRFSLFDPVFNYTFGDQSVNFQKETIKDFGFRGHSLAIDAAFIELTVAKGLSDPGLYQAIWPQNFFGLQFSFDVFDLWWLQTNISFISSLQGRYNSIKSSTFPHAIGTLYDLGSVKPEENLIFGLNTGTENDLFSLSAGMGLTLYNNDASSIIDMTKLANDINSGFGFDIAPYLTYVDMIHNIFPVLDYFPLSDGLITKALNRELWGLTYGADLKIPFLGLGAWYRKTDSAYRSLAASVDTDVRSIGALVERSIGNFSFSLGYEWTKDNIPDILFNEILPLFTGSGSSVAATEDDISNVVHTGTIGLGTPPSGIFGNISINYTFEWATTNAEELGLSSSTKNDTTLTHTGKLQWKSGRIKMGDFITNFGAKTEDSFITYAKVDGAANGSTGWEFSYGLDGAVQYNRYKLNLGFTHAWATAAASDVAYGIDAKFLVSKGFFDRVTYAAAFAPIFNSSAFQRYKVSGGLTLDKAIGILSTSAKLSLEYIDSLVDDTKDDLNAILTITGGISL
jgi:hypothetical protein